MSTQAPTAAYVQPTVNAAYAAPLSVPAASGPFASVPGAQVIAQQVLPNTPATPTITVLKPEQLEALAQQEITINTFYAKVVELRDVDAALRSAYNAFEAARATSAQVNKTVQTADRAVGAAVAVAANQVFANAQASADHAKADQSSVDNALDAAEKEYRQLYERKYELMNSLIESSAAKDRACLLARYKLGMGTDINYPVPADARVLTAEQLKLKIDRTAAVNSCNAALLAVSENAKALETVTKELPAAQALVQQLTEAKRVADHAYESAKLGSDEALKGKTASESLRLEKDLADAHNAYRTAYEAFQKLTASKLEAEKAVTEARAVYDNINREATAKGL